MLKHEHPIVEIPLAVRPQKPVIAQGWHGPYHGLIETSMNLDHAVDIAAPIHSIVTAAHDGVVLSLIMNNEGFSREMNLTPQQIIELNRLCTNWILVQCGDDKHGFQSLYAHLQRGSQYVQEGRRVFAGQKLARTDENGWVGDVPNLHFQLHRFVYPLPGKNIGGNVTIPFSFRGFDGPMEHSEIAALRISSLRR